MRNETVFTDANGSRIISYVEIERVGQDIIAREWHEGEEEIERSATSEEVGQIQLHERDQERTKAMQIIEEAKSSNNEQIAKLAHAFSTLFDV